MTAGARALLLVIASAALGAAYYAYVSSVDFPPALARVVPLLWLATAVAGWFIGVRAIRVGAGKAAAIAGLALNVPNTAFAVLFGLAALMGD